MGANIKYRMLGASGQANLVWADAADTTELAATACSIGSIGTIAGDPDKLYIFNGASWDLLDKPSLLPGSVPEYDGINPITLLAAMKLLQPSLLELNALNVMTTRGDIIVRGASAPERLELGGLGRVLYAGEPDPFWQIPGNLLISDTYNKYATDTIDGAFNELGALLAPDRKPEYIRATDPTAQNDQYEGMLLYNTTDQELKVCTTPGKAEVDTITVTQGAVTQGGTITVTLDNVDKTAEVLEGETVAQVAARILALDFEGWDAAYGDDVDKVVFTAQTVGTRVAPVFDDTDETGVTGTAVATQQGADATWITLAEATT